MAPKGKRAKRPSMNTMVNFVDKLNHHPNLEHAKDCPEALKAIYILINQTRLRHEDLNPQLEGQTFNASDIYYKQLMCRAQKLSRSCSARGMNEKPELKWQSAMSPHAFMSLNNEEEEETRPERQYHHW